MNSNRYTAYNYEKEILLPEGAPMFVLKVIDQKFDDEKFKTMINSDTLTIIYLYCAF